MPSHKSLFFSLLFLALAFHCSFGGRNARLENLADRTWMDVCAFAGQEAGAAEVPWAYDPDHRLFIRVGGCTNTYSNEISSFDLGTESFTFLKHYDANALDRPGCCCNRGTCYDPVSHALYTYGGATSNGGPCRGEMTFWKGDIAANQWTELRNQGGIQSHVACDTAAGKVVIAYWDQGTFKHTRLYDPAADSIWSCPAMPGNADTEWVYYPVNYWNALEYVPAMNGVMQVGFFQKDSAGGYDAEWYTWLFNTGTQTWTDLQAPGLPAAYGRAILSYDPVGRVVLLMIAGQGLFVYEPGLNAWTQLDAGTPVPGEGNGWSEMFEYDSEHNVHLFVRLYPANRVWAYRYANEGGTALQGAPFLADAPVLSCIPNPFASSTSIQYRLRAQAQVRMGIYDLTGSLVRMLVSEARPAGLHSLLWQGPGNARASAYLVRLELGENRYTQKLIHLK